MFEQYESVMTVEEACDALRIGKSRLYSLLRERKLKGYKEGRHWKIAKEEAIDYVRRERGCEKTRLSFFASPFLYLLGSVK